MATVISEVTRIEDVEGTISLSSIGGGPGASGNTDIFIQAAQSAGRRVSNATDKGFWITADTPFDLSAAGEHFGMWVWITHYGVATSLKIRAGADQTNYDDHTVPIASYPDLGGWFRVWIDISRAPEAIGGSGGDESAMDQFAITTSLPTVGGNVANLIMDALDHTLTGLGLISTGGVWNDFVVFDSIDGNRFGVLTELEGVLYCSARLTLSTNNVPVFDVGSEANFPRSVHFKDDGTKVYIIESTFGIVYQYSLSTAWDIATATKDAAELDASVGAAIGQGLFFKTDGTKLFTVGLSDGIVYSWTLSSAWDVSSGTKDAAQKDISTEESSPRGLAFKPDGTRMYVIGITNDIVYSYTLSSAWDVSSATKDTAEKSVNADETQPFDVFFKPDGLKMFIVGITNNIIFQYTLSTAWAVNTATKDAAELDVSGEGTEHNGLFFKGDGLNAYTTTSEVNNDTIRQYTLSTAWDVSTGKAGTTLVDSVVFNDSDFTIVFPDQSLVASNFMGITVDLEIAATNIDWADGVIRSAGAKQGDIIVTGTAGAFDATRMTLVNLRTINLTSVCNLLNSAITSCAKLNQNGATIDNCAISGAATADGEAFIISDNPTNIKNNAFTFSDGHALELTATGTYTLTANTFTDYGANGTTDAAIYNNSGGAVTLNVTGGVASPTIRNGTGASTTVNNNISLTISGLRDNTEVRVFTAGTTTELVGIENATDGTADDRSVTFSLAASTSVDIRFAHGIAADGNRYTVPPSNSILAFTWPTADGNLPITQVLDRSFDNPA